MFLGWSALYFILVGVGMNINKAIGWLVILKLFLSVKRKSKTGVYDCAAGVGW